MPGPHQLRVICRVLRAGGLIAYPTEGVYGLGCDPANPVALARLLALKHRSAGMGLILIAADMVQLRPWLAPLDAEVEQRLARGWPGPLTWVVPVAEGAPRLLTGGRHSLAVRVSAHPLCRQLCRAWGGPLVSTSANRHGRPPARSALQVRRWLGSGVDFVVSGPLGGLKGPTPIRDALDNRVLRAGAVSGNEAQS